MDSMNAITLSQAIIAEAKKIGFHSCGISKAENLPDDAARLKRWLDKGLQAEMAYMGNHFTKRTDPRRLVDNAKSVISVLYNYYPQEYQGDNAGLKLSKYAFGKDYHQVIKKKLKQLLEFIRQSKPDLSARVFTDSAPVLERAWARKAGLGWIGKNTNLITRGQGSFFFVGEIICNLDLDYNHCIDADHCGGCTRCIDACPTGALKPYELDSNRCISYWTIEYKGESIPGAFAGKFNKYIFGCDICQDVCPWNRLSEPHNEPGFRLSEALQKMSGTDWENLSEEQYRGLFRESPVKRSGYKGLKRNILFVSRKESAS
jgi:epoxyqueuosine reductase